MFQSWKLPFTALTALVFAGLYFNSLVQGQQEEQQAPADAEQFVTVGEFRAAMADVAPFSELVRVRAELLDLIQFTDEKLAGDVNSNADTMFALIEKVHFLETGKELSKAAPSRDLIVSRMNPQQKAEWEAFEAEGEALKQRVMARDISLHDAAALMRERQPAFYAQIAAEIQAE